MAPRPAIQITPQDRRAFYFRSTAKLRVLDGMRREIEAIQA